MSRASEEFTGHVVWVTGAASGIGASISDAFAASGAEVAAIDINEQGLDQLRDRVAGDAITPAVCDISAWEETRAACERLIDGLGPPSVVVANAGISPAAWVSVDKLDPGDWLRVLSVNLTGAFHIAKAACRHLCKTAPSSLLFTSSASGLGAGPGGAAYYASKHGVIGLMRTMANELGRDGVRVNALCPGWVNTPMLEEDIAESGGSRETEIALRVKQHLLPQLVEPEDVAQAALFLASPAGSAITGVAMPVDAGILEQRQWIYRSWFAATEE
jgi:3-hydroxybutyrate dehydrogenase